MGALDLRLRMYLALALIFSLGFGIIYAILLYIGLGFSFVIVFAVGFFALQWYISPSILKMAARLRYIGPDEYPELHQAVEEIAKNANVPVPRIAISPSKDANAFVFGRTVKSATLVVNEGILSILDGDELRAVLSHEVGHLRHNDVVVMTLVSFLPMIVYLIAQNFFYSGMFGGGRNNSGATLFAIGFAAFLMYFVLQFITLMISRARETYADEYSAEATQKPEDLASSLLKITAQNYSSGMPQGSTAARPFYFSDSYSASKDVKEIEVHAEEIKALLPKIDIKKFADEVRRSRSVWRHMGGLFATHPPAYKRIIHLAELKKAMKK